MAGISYGKGATLPEGAMRWLSPDEIDALVADGRKVRFFDARDRKEVDALGTIPGAEELAQSTLMFTTASVQPLIDALLAGDYGADELVFFANTAGHEGMSAGRELFVIAYLGELGVPYGRMARLAGGFHGWKASGRLVGSLGAPVEMVSGIDAFLEQAKLSHLAAQLGDGRTLRGLAEALEASRPSFLNELKELGVSKLADRQTLCNALGKARREGQIASG